MAKRVCQNITSQPNFLKVLHHIAREVRNFALQTCMHVCTGERGGGGRSRQKISLSHDMVYETPFVWVIATFPSIRYTQNSEIGRRAWQKSFSPQFLWRLVLTACGLSLAGFSRFFKTLRKDMKINNIILGYSDPSFRRLTSLLNLENFKISTECGWEIGKLAAKGRDKRKAGKRDVAWFQCSNFTNKNKL